MIKVESSQLTDAIKSIESGDAYSSEHYILTLRLLLSPSSYTIEDEEMAVKAFLAIRHAEQNLSARKVNSALSELLPQPE
jgi:hypothetical protein